MPADMVHRDGIEMGFVISHSSKPVVVPSLYPMTVWDAQFIGRFGGCYSPDTIVVSSLSVCIASIIGSVVDACASALQHNFALSRSSLVE